MAKHIKDKINLKSTLYKSKRFMELQNLSTEISNMISIRKEEYYVHLSKNSTPVPDQKLIGQF